MPPAGFTKPLKCVVLIDDDHINNYMNQHLLKSLNVSDDIVIQKNGHEGIQFIKKYLKKNDFFPELIFIDINMPVSDGFEFLEEFNKLNTSVQKPTFVVLTTSTDPRDIFRLRSLGIKYFFNKPLSKEKLSELMEKVSDWNPEINKTIE
jgi:CheY-like chemotaxis protein